MSLRTGREGWELYRGSRRGDIGSVEVLEQGLRAPDTIKGVFDVVQNVSEGRSS